MSLINDALKRASQAHKDKTPKPADGPTLQPVQDSAKSSKLPIIVGLMSLLVMIVGLSVWLLLGGSKPVTAIASGSPARPPLANSTNSVAKKTIASTNAPVVTAAAATQTNTPRAAVAPAAPHATTQAAVRAVSQVTNAAATNTPTAPVAKVTNVPSANVARVGQPTSPPPEAASAAVQTNKPAATATPVATTVPAPAPLTGPFPVLRLKGIIYAGASPQVLINGNHLTLGDEIDGAKIIKIEKTRVTVKWNGQTRELLPE